MRDGALAWSRTARTGLQLCAARVLHRCSRILPASLLPQVAEVQSYPDFELLFRSVPGCYVVLASDFTIVAASDMYLRATRTERDIVGKPIFDVFPVASSDRQGEELASLRASLERVLLQNVSDRMPAQKSGIEARVWSLLSTPMPALDGEVHHIILSIEDVTDNVQRDAKLHELMRAEQRSAQLLEAAPDAIVVVGAEGKIELVNAQTEKLFGYTRAELLHASLSVLIPEASRDRHAAHLHAYFRKPIMRPMGTGVELLARKKDGSTFPIEVSLSPMQDETGVSVSAAIRDISRRKRTEAEAKLSSERFASAVESMQDAFAMYDGNDRLLRCNAAYRDLLSAWLAEPLVGQTREQVVAAWLELVEPAGLTLTKDELRDRWLQGAREQAQTFDLRTSQKRSLRVASRPTSQGDVVEVVWDLTGDEQRADELRLLHAQAEAASAAKSEFLSSMSHELRTPLNAILGFAQLLLRDTKAPLSQRHRGRVDQILRGGEHLLRLIEDVLDLARIEAGRVSVSAEPVDIREVLCEVAATLQPMASRHEVELQLEQLSPDLPNIQADRVRLIQILMNFGSNATKYNRREGKVAFRVERKDAALRVVVEDDGLGIPLDQQPKLFQAFQRAGQEAGPIEGTGIGLLISKRLAEMMGGRVGFQSVPAQGSSFWVELPVSAPQVKLMHGRAKLATVGQDRAGPGGLVVYVEDNPANIAFMTDLFEGLEGYQLVTARTAEQGLVLSRSLRPEIVVMDINLPGMSGTQALSAMRQAPETRHIPVIALTAAASERDRKHGEQAGFFRYLTKPLNVDELISALHAALERATLPLGA